MQNLAGQLAIISGGLGDIGRACAVELARRGADIAVGGLSDKGRAKVLGQEIESLGRRFRFDVADTSDAVVVGQWLAAVEDDLGPVTLAVPNAAIVEMADLSKLTPAVWQRHLDVNLSGSFYLAHAVAERLVQLQRPGRIVFIGSWAAHAVHRHIPAYCVAKAGLRMACRTMALHYARHDILVNEVAPGIVNAGLSAKVFEENPQLADATRRKIPIGEMMEAEEVALHVAHLCDPRNRNVTGSVLLCDGGISLVASTEIDEEDSPK